jgi:hypothetical protein
VTRLNRASVIVVAALLMAGTPRISAGVFAPAREYEIKAGLLYNFARFVEWPADAFRGDGDELRFEVVGHDPFDGALDRLVAGKTIHTHRIVTLYSTGESTQLHGHVVFIAESEKRHLANLLTVVRQKPVLTVSDMDGFAQGGGVIGLMSRDDSIRFVINRAAATDARLHVSSRLLSLAALVERQTGQFRTTMPTIGGELLAGGMPGATDH